jgi:hypothetical protein
MLKEFAKADIVIIPATDTYKSANRAIEAIRQGCFVVAEPHPSLEGFPIYIGNIKKGIEWTRQNNVNTQLLQAQLFVMENFSPQILQDAWKKTTAQRTTLDVEQSTGTTG